MLNNKKAQIGPDFEIDFETKDFKIVCLSLESLYTKKPVDFKLKITGLKDEEMVGRIVYMLEVARNWYKIETPAELYDGRKKIADLARDYLQKDFPKEKDLQLEIYDIAFQN